MCVISFSGRCLQSAACLGNARTCKSYLFQVCVTDSTNKCWIPCKVVCFSVMESIDINFHRHEDKEMKLKAAEAHLKLGEVGLETEQYETAIEDFKSCLKIQQNFLDAESRLIAETYPYQHLNLKGSCQL